MLTARQAMLATGRIGGVFAGFTATHCVLQQRFGIDNAISAFASGYVTIGAVHMVSPARVDLLRAFADDIIGKQAKAWPPAAAKLFTGRTFLLNAAALSGGITLGGLYTLLKVVGLNW